MGNRLCCGESWSCPSTFQRKKKMGSQARWTLKQQQQQQNGTKGHDPTGRTYEQVLKQPVSQERSQGLRSEESSLHYADIQVCSLTQTRSAQEAPDAQAQRPWLTGPAAPRHVGSSRTGARTRVPCIGRWTLNHCATTEGPVGVNLIASLLHTLNAKAEEEEVLWKAFRALVHSF
ncbi:uncharacterized protein C11orf52 homolog isoform X1 [Kogia breviceps]|uniref:uncharacterized protein C11orf52 homolog isoform X1 n=1 Tax=Kogia breviceps TaxID=27615 RepID=UPI0034D163A4